MYYAIYVLSLKPLSGRDSNSVCAILASAHFVIFAGEQLHDEKRRPGTYDKKRDVEDRDRWVHCHNPKSYFGPRIETPWWDTGLPILHGRSSQMASLLWHIRA